MLRCTDKTSTTTATPMTSSRKNNNNMGRKVLTSERETTQRINVASSVPAPFMDFHSRSAKYSAGFLEHSTEMKQLQ